MKTLDPLSSVIADFRSREKLLALDLGTHTGWAILSGAKPDSGVQVFDVRRGESPGWITLGGLVRQVEQRNASAYRDAARVLRIVGGVKIRKYGKLGDGIDIPSEDKLVAVIKRLRRRAERGQK